MSTVIKCAAVVSVFMLTAASAAWAQNYENNSGYGTNPSIYTQPNQGYGRSNGYYGYGMSNGYSGNLPGNEWSGLIDNDSSRARPNPVYGTGPYARYNFYSENAGHGMGRGH